MSPAPTVTASAATASAASCFWVADSDTRGTPRLDKPWETRGTPALTRELLRRRVTRLGVRLSQTMSSSSRAPRCAAARPQRAGRRARHPMRRAMLPHLGSPHLESRNSKTQCCRNWPQWLRVSVDSGACSCFTSCFCRLFSAAAADDRNSLRLGLQCQPRFTRRSALASMHLRLQCQPPAV